MRKRRVEGSREGLGEGGRKEAGKDEEKEGWREKGG